VKAPAKPSESYEGDKMKRVRNMSTALSSWVQAKIDMPAGDVFFLCPASSSTAQYIDWLQANGVEESHYFTGLPAAYAALTAGRNDTLCVFPGSYTLTSAFTWAKDYTHMIGLAPRIPVNQRCRISSTTAALSPLITFSADGSLMSNIMWSQDGSHATTAAINCAMSGDRNRLEYVTFRNLGALAYVDNSMRNLKITSGDGENYYKYCNIGADSIDMVTGAGVAIEYAGTNTARDTYEKCNILSGGSVNGTFLTAGTNATTAWTKFLDCDFVNNILGSMDSMTQGFSIGGGNGYFLMAGKTRVHGCDTLETTNSGLIVGENAVAAATSNTYVALTF
jgi:hypothetical protein